MAASPIQLEVERQREIDRDFGNSQTVLISRIRAVIAAQVALAAHEPGARPALRQGLVDLASVAELLADDLVLDEAPGPTTQAG